MVVVPFLFDWNETHVFNTRWPPHAKFHLAHTILISVLLSLGSLWQFWRRKSPSSAVLMMAIFWIAQAGSIFFPGTAFVDPEFTDSMPIVIGVRLNQLMIDGIVIGMLCLAGWLLKEESAITETRLEF